MLSDARYRAWVVKQVKDPIVQSFWVIEFENYEGKFLQEAIAPIQNKVGHVTGFGQLPTGAEKYWKNLVVLYHQNIIKVNRDGLNMMFSPLMPLLSHALMIDRLLLIKPSTKGILVATWIDFKELRSKLNFEQVLNQNRLPNIVGLMGAD